jgi:DDE family transposase
LILNPALKPQKCTHERRAFGRRLVLRAKCSILAARQKPSILDGYWRGRQPLLFPLGEMRKGLQTLDFSFEAQSLTHFGGLFLIQRFCNRLCLRRRLERILKDRPNWAEYHPADLVLVLLYVLIAGLPRVNKTQILHYNGLFLSLVGLETFPDETALRRFLHRLSPKAIRQIARLHDQLRNQLFSLPEPRSSLVFHLDSVVLTLYGKQQGARRGYNPKKRGRPSYHPLLCFEAHGQEFWHGSLRAGDAAANTGARALVRRCLEKVPSHVTRSRVRLLADAGYFSGKLVSDLDQAGCGYIIVCPKAKLYLPLAQKAGFQEMSFGWAVAEFRFKPRRWDLEHRFVMVRRPLPEDPEEAQQLTLLKVGRCAYSAFVTNLPLQPWMIWKTYQARANVEKSIRELLQHFSLNKIPTHSWVANVAFLQLLLLAYNLVHWFKRLCLPEDYARATVETIRNEFLVLPAKLAKHGSRNVLQLPSDYDHREIFLKAARRIQMLRLPHPAQGEKFGFVSNR